MNYKALLSNTKIHYCVCILVGIIVGVVLYPSSSIKEEIIQKYEKQIQTIKQENYETNQKTKEIISKMESDKAIYKQEMEYKLKQSRKIVYTKIIKPDGTVEIRRTEDTDTASETTSKIEEIKEQHKQELVRREQEVEQKFESKLKVYEKEISELKSKKTIETNRKNFGAEIGISTQLVYYGHFTYDVAGPFFFGIDLETSTFVNPKFDLGAGLGVRF